MQLFTLYLIKKHIIKNHKIDKNTKNEPIY